MPLLTIADTYDDVVTTVFSSTIVAKVWLATAAIVLALVQVSTAARMWGRLQRVIPIGNRTAARIHRWSGRLAVLCTLPVIFHCVTILGFKTTDLRVAIHSIAGSFVYGVLAAKLLAIRIHRYPGWVIPVLGGTLAVVLAILWLSSSAWYFDSVGFRL